MQWVGVATSQCSDAVDSILVLSTFIAQDACRKKKMFWCYIEFDAIREE